MTNLTGTEKQIVLATEITSVIKELISIGAEELIRRDALRNAEQNGSYETEEEMLENVEKIVARKMATLSKPKESKGISRILNYERITDASDLITIGNGVDVSWEGFFKLISGIRGDHFSYLD